MGQQHRPQMPMGQVQQMSQVHMHNMPHMQMHPQGMPMNPQVRALQVCCFVGGCASRLAGHMGRACTCGPDVCVHQTCR